MVEWTWREMDGLERCCREIVSNTVDVASPFLTSLIRALKEKLGFSKRVCGKKRFQIEKIIQATAWK